MEFSISLPVSLQEKLQTGNVTGLSPANVGLLKSISIFCLHMVSDLFCYFYFFHRCVMKLKLEFIQDMIAKYGREHLGDIDIDS